jgi:hypothetical protein
MNYTESAAIRVAAEAQLADHLLEYPEGLPLSTLTVKTGIHEQKLGSVLRLLATRHCFRESKPSEHAAYTDLT